MKMLALAAAFVAASLPLAARASDAVSGFKNFRYPVHSAVLNAIVTGSDGNLWFTDATHFALVRLTPDGAMTPFGLAASLDKKSAPFAPQMLAVGADGRFYMSGCFDLGHHQTNCNYVGIATTAGSFSAVSLKVQGPGSVYGGGGMALGPDNNVWFPLPSGYGRIATSEVITTYSYPAEPGGSVAASTASMYFNEIVQGGGGNTGYVVQVDPVTGSVVSTAKTCVSQAMSFGLIEGGLAVHDGKAYTGCEIYRSGQSWFFFEADKNAKATGYVNVPGQATSAQAYAMTRDGDVWFSSGWPTVFDPAQRTLTVFPAPFEIRGNAVTVGPDHDLWFLNSGDKPSVTRVRLHGSQDAPRTRTAAPPTWRAFRSRGLIPAGLTSGSDGRLWYTDAKRNRLFAMTTAGAETSYTLTSAHHGFIGGRVTSGADGKLYMGGCLKLAQCTASYIGVSTTTGTFVALATPSGDGPGMDGGLVTGTDGNVWVSERTHIARVTPAGAITEYPLPEGLDGAGGVSSGPDGRVWFVPVGDEGEKTPIGAIDVTTGTIAMYSGQCTSGNAPQVWDQGIVSADGSLFVSCWDTNYSPYIEQVSTSGVATVLNNPFQGTVDPFLGPDGHAWFIAGFSIEQLSEVAMLERYDPTIPSFTGFPAPLALQIQPVSAITGPDGNVWFAAYGELGRYTPAGKG
jgi:virginiamycin B lyase